MSIPITVLSPAYNKGTTIRCTFESLLRQTNSFPECSVAMGNPARVIDSHILQENVFAIVHC